MEFSNSTTEDGLIQEVDRLCGSTDNTFSLKAKTARINQALDRFITLALQSDGTWQFDDSNQTDLPIGVTNLVSGQQDYAFNSAYLFIKKVLVKDSAGTWTEIIPVGMMEDEAANIWTLPSNNSGVPTRYNKFANSVLLDPIPNYNSTGGLKVVFARNKVAFVSTDTTAVPGIPSLFHKYLCRMAALDYCIINGLKQTAGISALIQQDEREIGKYYTMRNKDEKKRLSVRQENNR